MRRPCHLIGVVAFHKGEKEKALRLMEKAIACGIDTPPYYRNIGEIYRVPGHHEQARDAAVRSRSIPAIRSR